MKGIIAALVLFSLAAIGKAQVIQRVIVEEHTGAWCGYCPDGALIMQDLLNNEPDAIGVSIHEGDAMQIAASGYIRNFYGPAFPQATINRQGAPISRGQWASATATALQDNPIVSVSFDSVAFNTNSRILTVRIKASFVRDTTGPLRFNVYVLEDEVTGTGANYDQVNYYNTTSGHPLFGLGNPIVGFVHNHVLRECLGGAWGTGGQIPSTVYAGDDFTYTYNYYMPTYVDWGKVHLVAMVNCFSGSAIYQRSTLNGDEMPLTMAVGVQDPEKASAVQVWPNPASSRVNVSFTMENAGNVSVEIFNLNGQRVAELANGFTNSGTHTVTWSGQTQQGNTASAGIYFVKVQPEEGQATTSRLVFNPNH